MFSHSIQTQIIKNTIWTKKWRNIALSFGPNMLKVKSLKEGGGGGALKDLTSF